MKRLLIFAAAVLLILPVSARLPKRGYRGFVEWSNSLRSEKFMEWNMAGIAGSYRENTFYTGLTTSHGYQINPMFFVGAGFGMERCTTYDNWVAPLFLQGRIDLKFGKFTPFGDLRIGANIAEGTGVYFSPSIGYRFNWGRKVGINIGAGLTLAGYKVDHYEGTVTGPDSYEIYYVGRRSHMRAYFSFRLGLDF